MDSIADLSPVSADPHPHAAHPTPPPSSNGGAHPPYSEMIVAAIAALQDKDGSSRQAIAKYIEKEYANLPPTHSSLLTHHLKRMKNEGELMMVKHSYMLPPPRSVPFQLPTPTMDLHVTDYSVTPTDTFKRKPGRPPKQRPDFGFQLPEEQRAADITPYQPQFEHHQGNYSEPIFASLGLADDGVAPTPTSAKRGRGRPPKGASAAGGDVEAGKRLGRRKPGRPKLMSIIMANGGGAKRSAGRPKRIGGPVTVPLSGNVMRRRGRPKRSVSWSSAQNISVNTGDADTGSVSRGRGRPPKIRKLSSQPFGWSNKVESGTAVLVTDPHQLVAFQELKFKYERLQSKAKEVLSVVRPYINSDYSVFGAVQELETLVVESSNV